MLYFIVFLLLVVFGIWYYLKTKQLGLVLLVWISVFLALSIMHSLVFGAEDIPPFMIPIFTVLSLFFMISLLVYTIVSQPELLYLDTDAFVIIAYISMLLLLGAIAGTLLWKKTKNIKHLLKVESVALLMLALPLYFAGGIALIYLAIFLILGAVAGILLWEKTKNIKHLLKVESVVLFMLALPQLIFAAVMAFSDLDIPDILYRLEGLTYVSDKLEIIELDMSSEFDIKINDRYNSTVLIKNHPENLDSLKNVMLQFFEKKSQFIDSVYPGKYLGRVDFYEYTRKTAYFIDNSYLCRDILFCKDGSFSDLYPKYRIGYISVQNPCENDSTKYEDIMFLYSSGNRIREILRSECDGVHIDNWGKYLSFGISQKMQVKNVYWQLKYTKSVVL